jgi:hypothetical protein
VPSSPVHFNELFTMRPVGSRTWCFVMGGSLRPLLNPGDELLMERCGVLGAQEGDIVLGRRHDGVLLSHVLQCASPLSTASFLGQRDEPTPEILGRAVAFRRGGRTFEVSPITRAAVKRLHQAASLAWRMPATRWLAARRRSTAALPEVSRVSAIEVRHAAELLRLVGSTQPELNLLRSRQAWTAMPPASGGFDDQGRLRVVALVDEEAPPRLRLRPLAPVLSESLRRELLGRVLAQADAMGMDEIQAGGEDVGAFGEALLTAHAFTAIDGLWSRRRQASGSGDATLG